MLTRHMLTTPCFVARICHFQKCTSNKWNPHVEVGGKIKQIGTPALSHRVLDQVTLSHPSRGLMSFPYHCFCLHERMCLLSPSCPAAMSLLFVRDMFTAFRRVAEVSCGILATVSLSVAVGQVSCQVAGKLCRVLTPCVHVVHAYFRKCCGHRATHCTSRIDKLRSLCAVGRLRGACQPQPFIVALLLSCSNATSGRASDADCNIRIFHSAGPWLFRIVRRSWMPTSTKTSLLLSTPIDSLFQAHVFHLLCPLHQSERTNQW